MKERAVMIGARLEIESRRGTGTSVRLSLPTGKRAP
jgi:signal transduction histidine kinase